MEAKKSRPSTSRCRIRSGCTPTTPASRAASRVTWPRSRKLTPFLSVLGVDRQGVRRHTFVGGNFLLAKHLDRYRDELA